MEKDSLEWENGKQWPFSVYAPIFRRVLPNAVRRSEENLPGFADFSPEELRWETKMAESNGRAQDYINQIQFLETKFQNMRRTLQKIDHATGRFIVRIFPFKMQNFFPKRNVNTLSMNCVLL